MIQRSKAPHPPCAAQVAAGRDASAKGTTGTTSAIAGPQTGAQTAPRILALDLSLTATGHCLDGDTGLIKTPASRISGWERVRAILKPVQDVLFEIDMVVLEGYSFGSQGRAVFQIGEFGGIVRYALWSAGLPYVDVPPSTLKKFATGKGNADKDAMIAAAIRRFGFKGSENNEADAFLLYCMARHAYGHPVARVTQVQAEQVGKVEWPEVQHEPTR